MTVGVTLCRERPDVRELHEPALDRRAVENDTSEVVRGRIGRPRDVAGSVAAAPNRVFWPRGGEHRFSGTGAGAGRVPSNPFLVNRKIDRSHRSGPINARGSR